MLPGANEARGPSTDTIDIPSLAEHTYQGTSSLTAPRPHAPLGIQYGG